MDNILAFFCRRLTTIPDRDSFLNKIQEMLSFFTDVHLHQLISLTTSQGCKGEAKIYKGRSRATNMRRKKSKGFSSTFEEKALLPNGHLRDIDSRNHAINPSRLEKNRTFTPSLIVYYG